MAYGTAALIKSVESVFATDSTTFTDEVLLAWCTNFADPEIDARLAAAGFTTPVPATVPALICSISSMLAAAHGLDSYVGQRTFSTVERADALRKWAREMLDSICKGEADIGLTQSAAGEQIAYEDDHETFHANAAVVANEESWAWPVEDRES